MGTISIPVAGGLVVGSDGVVPRTSSILARSNIRYPVGGSLVMRVTPTVRPVGPAQPVPVWSAGYAGGVTQSGAWGPGSQWGGWNNNAQSRTVSVDGLNLAQMQQVLQSNPSALTPAQIQALQAAGTVPGTLPGTSASLVNSTGGAIDPATGQSYASEVAAANAAAASASSSATASGSILGTDPTTGATTIFGVDWYYVAAVAALGVYMLTGRRR
jgi:hypothetical protein